MTPECNFCVSILFLVSISPVGSLGWLQDWASISSNSNRQVGTDLKDLLGTEMFEATAEGNWVTTESVRVWVVGYDGMVFGSGWHKDESGG